MIYSCFECVCFKHSLLFIADAYHGIKHDARLFGWWLKIAVLCDVMPCSLVVAYRRCKCLQHSTVSHPWRQKYAIVKHICRGARLFRNSWSHHKMLGWGRLTWGMLHTYDPQIFGAITQYLVAVVTARITSTSQDISVTSKIF